MTDFIGIYENAFTKEYCKRVINYFDEMQARGFTQNRMQAEGFTKVLKDDHAFYGHGEESLNFQNIGKLYFDFNKQFWSIYKDQYASKFSVLNECGLHNSYSYKIQKTPIGGGYHTWHFESDCRQNSLRLTAWTLYLNDVEEGGETEFLYQHKRIKPKQGTLCIFPASYTHTHRGNPPLSNDKYIVTGWTEF